ncbi:peptide ABC transporter substrate-binding protein [bacterium]|nr:MAG: peptide ABC transporter substrate-binding protein [bacterium]
MRRASASLAAVLTLVAAAAGCTKVVSGTGGAAYQNPKTIPGVLRYTDATEIHGLNPLIETEAANVRIDQMVMAYLFRWDKESRPVPELATEVPTERNGGISKNGLTITYHLRRGVVWSDGAPFTAKDVLFSYHAVMNPANNVPGRDGWDLIVKAEAPDPYTVRFTLKQPYAPFIFTFFSTGGANPCILPEHLLAKYHDLNNVPYNSKPVGIGPYMVAQWKRGQEVRLVANPRYWRGLPKLKEVDDVIISNTNTAQAEMQSGDIDLWLDVPSNNVPQISGIARITMLNLPSKTWDHADFNTSHPVVADPRVRLAIEYAWPRREISQKVSHGLNHLQESFIPATLTWAYRDLPFRQQDLGKARSLLDAAGWTIGGDGLRHKDGRPMIINFAATAGSPSFDSSLVLAAQELKRVGIELNVQHYAADLYFAPYQNNGILNRGRFDMTAFAWGGQPDPDPSTFLACGQVSPNGQNDARYCNREVDALLLDAKRHYDLVRRGADYKRIQGLVERNVPLFVQDFRIDHFAVSKDLEHYDPADDTPFDDMMNVTI